ncbi:E3 ubiquitin-protein ligase SINAT4-like [Silene latifolia]|uniref:E3 ubiquitin-protein ligase SINAT4-like n=1 Tax=Silene latifolia TaxID=37657 RepID=UPI003D77986B
MLSGNLVATVGMGGGGERRDGGGGLWCGSEALDTQNTSPDTHVIPCVSGTHCGFVGARGVAAMSLGDDIQYLNDLDDLRAKLAVTRATADASAASAQSVFHCFGQYFCLHFEAFQLSMAPVYMAFLRFMGDESEARKYNPSLEAGGYGRKLTSDGPPRRIRDSHRKVRDSHDGLIIQHKLALFFSGGDMKELKLPVTGRISKGGHNYDSGTSF